MGEEEHIAGGREQNSRRNVAGDGAEERVGAEGGGSVTMETCHSHPQIHKTGNDLHCSSLSSRGNRTSLKTQAFWGLKENNNF